MQINIYQDNLFDIEKQPTLIFNQVDHYYDFCRQEYFECCRDVRVLELSGGHEKEILSHCPEYFKIIEGSKIFAENLKSIDGVDDVVIADMMMALKDTEIFDVVICLGVLYHLHSPLHLLELIVNNCRPSKIILDCVMAPEELSFLLEIPNVPGNNQTTKGWRSCNVNLVAPFLTYLQSMDQLGYNLKKVDRIHVENYFSKDNSWMALWEIK
jgi:SAM-dependent methyltransferase